MFKQLFFNYIFLLFSPAILSQSFQMTGYESVSQKLKILDKHIEVCLANEQFSEAKEAAILGLKLSKQIKVDSSITRYLYELASAYKSLSNFDSAIFYFKEVLEPVYKIPPVLLAKTQLNLASSYENVGQMDSVFSIMKKLETNRYLQTDSLSSENVKYLMFRGILNEDKANYEKALTDYMSALRISQAINDTAAITDNLVNIGAFYFNIGKYTKSMEYYEQAEINFSQSGKSKSLQACTAFRTMGIALERTGNAELGIRYAENAITIAKALEITKLLNFCYGGIATIYLETKNYKKAEHYYLQALDLLKNTDLRFNQLSIYGQLGLVNFEQKKYGEAKSYFEKANQLALELGRKSSISSSYKDLAKTEAALGNYSRAYKYLQINSAYQDSINAEISNKNIAEMEAKYQNEKKRQEISLLNEKNKTQTLELKNRRLGQYFLLGGLITILLITILLWRSYRIKQKSIIELGTKNSELSAAYEEITVINEKLSEANQSKSKLFSIISHDLRAPVISLFQFLRMQNKDSSIADEDFKNKHSRLIEQSAENLLDVMEDILIWAKSQMEHFELSFEPVAVNDLLDEIIRIHKIHAGQKNIGIQVACPADLIFNTDANFLRIIIRNLMSNAIKFSPEGKTVEILVAKTQAGIILKIKNPGKSMSKEQIADLNNWQSIKSSPSGMGLKLTKEFVEKLHGTLDLHSDNENGTEFIVTLNSI